MTADIVDGNPTGPSVCLLNFVELPSSYTCTITDDLLETEIREMGTLHFQRCLYIYRRLIIHFYCGVCFIRILHKDPNFIF